MNNLIYQLKTWLIFAGHSLAISAVFCGAKWLVSLTSLCGSPNWKEFLFGAVGIFILYNIVGLFGVIKHYRNNGLDPNSAELTEKLMYLYDTLHDKNIYVASASHFQKMFLRNNKDGAEFRRNVWMNMCKCGEYHKSYEDFCTWLGVEP